MGLATAPRRTRLTTAQQRSLLYWEVGAFVWIMIAGSALHFTYELSSFNPVAALFGSVNESTWEHLKLFFWPGLAYAVVQHAFVKDYANNFWLAKAAALFVTPLGVIFSFYFYLGIALPRYGEGFLWADIGTGALGVLAGNIVAYRILTSPPRSKRSQLSGKVAILAMTAVFLLLTYFPIRVFLFEDFIGYEYRGEYGILDDYSEHLVFSEPDF